MWDKSAGRKCKGCERLD
jgi:predicted Fe-S protein YdhL (DUF1289 family)